MKNNFINAEEKERRAINYLPKLFPEIEIEEISDIQNFSSHDFMAISGTTYFRGEVKIRSFNHDKYPTAVLELTKVNKLINENTEDFITQNRQLYYFTFYREDKMLLVFDIYNTPTTITYEYCPKTTMGDNTKKHKAMVNYKIEDAIIKIKYK